MTREEAIKHGKEQLEIFGGTHRTFIEMAIKALEQPAYTSQIAQKAYEDGKKDGYVQAKLEQEPTTKNDLGVDREDAVERLNAIKQLIGYDKDSEIVKATQKSLDMAIKALEHPEKNVVAVVPCGDCISREQALKELKESAEYHANDSREEALLRRDRDIIRALPSVTPQEPKTGHWMKSNIGGAKVCSVCNAHMGLSSFKFCPNCGAKMVEPQESEVEDGKID